MTTTTTTLQYMTTQAAHAEHTDALSRDSGVSSAQLMHSYADEELPTDLSMQQQQQQPEQPQQMIYYQQQQPSLVELQPTAAAGLTINPALLEAASMARRDHDNVQVEQEQETEQQRQQQDEEDDVKAAALQMMQLRRGHASTPTLTHTPTSMSMSVPIATPIQQPTLHVSDLAANYDDTDEANVLIEHFKRGDLARHGLHKGYAPVPKYE